MCFYKTTFKTKHASQNYEIFWLLTLKNLDYNCYMLIVQKLRNRRVSHKQFCYLEGMSTYLHFILCFLMEG